MMKRLYITIASAVFLCVNTMAQGSPENRQKIDTLRHYEIEDVHVTGIRPLKETGVQKTHIEEALLHDNISSSIADILSQNSTIFIKNYGRATLSTASFRGTSPSHTQVTWNGMKINSPTIGQVDFSMIPSYFIDDATLLHGTSSVNFAGGGVGGAVSLSTVPENREGFGLQYVQGIGSFHTFDEFLRVTYGRSGWQSSTRVAYASSRNDYRYRNYSKADNLVYDDEGNLISYEHPVERNRNGQFNDLHILQEVYYNSGKAGRFGLAAWYVNSLRGVPMIKSDYRDESEYTNKQKDHTFRGVLSWDKVSERLKLGARAGYMYTYLRYDYNAKVVTNVDAIDVGNYVNSLYGLADMDYSVNDKLVFTANLSYYRHFLKGRDYLKPQSGQPATEGRSEISGYLSAKWRPNDRLGLSAVLREDIYGGKFAPVVPAFFVDFLASHKGNILLKASVSRHHRFPSLNDLYFQPGGNPALKPERGFSYDAGVEFLIENKDRFTLKGELTGFDSYIYDWIIWLPGVAYWEPSNIKMVHAYGAEIKGTLEVPFSRGWNVRLNGNYAYTPSINRGDPLTEGDASVGKQLVYVPLHSSAVTGRLTWKSWAFTYQWRYYSERFVTSSNERQSRRDVVLPYFMSDISLSKDFAFKWGAMSIKGVVNNIFDEEYESVLQRPMPRANFQLLLEIRLN